MHTHTQCCCPPFSNDDCSSSSSSRSSESESPAAAAVVPRKGFCFFPVPRLSGMHPASREQKQRETYIFRDFRCKAVVVPLSLLISLSLLFSRLSVTLFAEADSLARFVCSGSRSSLTRGGCCCSSPSPPLLSLFPLRPSTPAAAAAAAQEEQLAVQRVEFDFSRSTLQPFSLSVCRLIPGQTGTERRAQTEPDTRVQ